MARSWEDKLERAKAFFKEHGRWPYRFADDRAEHELGEWCYGQRCRFKRGVLAPDRQARLEASGFSWDPYGDTWLAHFNELKRFIEKRGRWPEWRAEDAKEAKLGTWCTRQRTHRKEGKAFENDAGTDRHAGRYRVQLGCLWGCVTGSLR